MPFPPSGFKSEQYPLRHELEYSYGMSMATAALGGTICTLVKHYKAANAPVGIEVNPHNASNFEIETGAICNKMSIIEKLRMSLKFNLTDKAIATNKAGAVKIMWMPIFFSFPEKLDAADDATSVTVAAILELVKDATQEDVTPLFNNSKFATAGTSDLNHPVSTSNFTEVFGTLNMDTDISMEGVTFDTNLFHQALKYYTNKGALKACIGGTRTFTLTNTHPSKSFFINKFVPSAVRRIVPYSYFGILTHVYDVSNPSQYYYSNVVGTSTADVGVKLICRYNEWNPDHFQDMSGTGT